MLSRALLKVVHKHVAPAVRPSTPRARECPPVMSKLQVLAETQHILEAHPASFPRVVLVLVRAHDGLFVISCALTRHGVRGRWRFGRPRLRLLAGCFGVVRSRVLARLGLGAVQHVLAALQPASRAFYRHKSVFELRFRAPAIWGRFWPGCNCGRGFTHTLLALWTRCRRVEGVVLLTLEFSLRSALWLHAALRQPRRLRDRLSLGEDVFVRFGQRLVSEDVARVDCTIAEEWGRGRAQRKRRVGLCRSSNEGRR